MKKIAILMSVIMLVALTAGVSMAAEKKHAAKLETMSGQIVKIDSAAGNIVIMSDGKEYTLKAEAKLLEGFAAGEQVKIEKTADVLKSIQKVEAPAIK
jgi:hypothetical protein